VDIVLQLRILVKIASPRHDFGMELGDAVDDRHVSLGVKISLCRAGQGAVNRP
jgi:hypothetical protein